LTQFTDFNLNPALGEALAAEGYTTPTPIQCQAIPLVMTGRDLVGIAQTGTGKTAAFALPILHRLAADRRKPQPRRCRVLVLSPTRELATQIAESFRTYGRLLGVTVAVVFGGVGHRPQQQALARGVDVLVATPGRLLDHMGERNLDLSGTEIAVLDEADQMLDLGFVQPIRRILGHVPKQRQMLLFSATMPSEIGRLAEEFLKNPAKVAVKPAATTAERVSQHVYLIEAQRKRALLVELLADPSFARTLIFTRTKRGADRVASHLEAAGIAVAAIHGNKSQTQRERALAAFKDDRIRALVATDIAARGIDVDNVSHVINYELPDVPESYVHRIGRTARAGAEGIAISLCDGEERGLLRDIERVTRQSIPMQDRRNDTALAQGAEPARRRPHRQERPRDETRGGRDGHRKQGHRHDGQRHGHDGHRKNGHRHGGASQGDGHGHRQDHGQASNGHHANGSARPSKANGNGNGHRPAAAKGAPGPSGVQNVAFLSRPTTRGGERRTERDRPRAEHRTRRAP
jgi:ATP-dependent RNA helicase RhlE